MDYTNSEVIAVILLIEENCRSHSSLRGMLKDAIDNPELIKEEADKIRFSYKLLDALVIICYNKIKELHDTNEEFVVSKYHDPYWRGKNKWKIKFSRGSFDIVDEYDSDYYGYSETDTKNHPFIISRIRSSLFKELQFYYYDTLEKFLKDENITEEVRGMLNSEDKIDSILMLQELLN